MSATTEEARERESKVDELMEDVPFDRMDPPPSELAAETPLTKAAVVHLRAAAAEVSRAYGDVHALLDTVERALSEPVGGEKTLSEEERVNLAALVRQARDKADHGMLRPVFARGRGERPHGGVQENGDGVGPDARISDQDLQTLGVLLHAAALAADGELGNGKDRTPREVRRTWGRLVDQVKPVYKRLLASRGITYSDRPGSSDDMDYGLAIVNEARAAAAESVDDGNGGDPSRVDVDALYEIAVLAQYALGTAADGELEDLTGVSPRKVFAALSEHLDGAVRDAGRLLNRDEDAVLDAAAERVRELAGGE